VIVVWGHGRAVRPSGGCVHRVRCASARPNIFFEPAVRSPILYMLSRSQRQAPKHAECSEANEFVDSGRKSSRIQKLVRPGGGGVLAFKEVGVDCAGRYVSGLSHFTARPESNYNHRCLEASASGRLQ
jgi:hypothetical protein